MIVYRVCKAEYSKDLSGNGARLYGGRWNSVGTACLYSSASRALAVLEYSVNLNILELSKSLVFTLIEIPEDEIFEVNIDELPENWNFYPVNTETRLFGDNLLKSCKKEMASSLSFPPFAFGSHSPAALLKSNLIIEFTASTLSPSI